MDTCCACAPRTGLPTASPPCIVTGRACKATGGRYKNADCPCTSRTPRSTQRYTARLPPYALFLLSLAQASAVPAARARCWGVYLRMAGGRGAGT